MLKKQMTPLGKKGTLHKHVGKGAVEQHLPYPGAQADLGSVPPAQRTMNNYAKATPLDVGQPDTSPMASDDMA